MTETPEKNEKKASFIKFFKWSALVLGIIGLELGAIYGGAMLSESKNTALNDKIKELSSKLSGHENRLAQINILAQNISENANRIGTTESIITLVNRNLNTLKDEVGNNKLENLSQKITHFNHRIEALEETQNREALVLSLALIIKENALYNRPFTTEAEVLSTLADNQKELTPSVNAVNELKNTLIPSNTQLVAEFSKIAENFSFEKPALSEQEKLDENAGTLSKGIALIKDKVAEINFDKVVLIKRDTKTEAQKQLFAELTKLVEAHNFNGALEFINANPAFAAAENGGFNKWVQDITVKNRFEAAISHIIASELNALRQDFKKMASDKEEAHPTPVEAKKETPEVISEKSPTPEVSETTDTPAVQPLKN